MNKQVDLIDREKAIEGVWEIELAGLDNKKIVGMLKGLPSVTPQEPISDILEDIYFDIEKEYKDCVIGKLDDDEMYPCFRQITDIYGLLDIIGKYIDKYKAESESQKSEEA